MNQEERDKKLAQFIAKSWSDKTFRKKLLADATATLKAEGLALPDGMSVKVMENTDKVYNLIIPAKPSSLTDEELDGVSGGLALPCQGDFNSACHGQVMSRCRCVIIAPCQGDKET